MALLRLRMYLPHALFSDKALASCDRSPSKTCVYGISSSEARKLLVCTSANQFYIQ